MTQKGFSLVEILITMSLMAVLAIPAFGQYITTQQRARDAVRRHDISEISNALEQYYAICGLTYPSNYTFLTNQGAVYCASPSIAVMPKSPKDPGVNTYACSGSCSATGYTICARLEADKAPTPTGFCLTNRQ